MSGTLETSPAAVLFDIDGTLVRSTPTHLHAMATAMGALLGVDVTLDLEAETPMLDGRPVAGFIDTQCLAQVAARAGVAVTPELRERFFERYVTLYHSALDDGAPVGELLPGARAALEHFARAGVPLALTTGNACGVAQLKLRRLGLEEFFSFDPDAGFSDRATDRPAVVAAALRSLPQASQSAPVVLVGDTIGDMVAAWSNRCLAIGVTTGAAPAHLLEANGAHAVIDSLELLLGLLDERLAELVAQETCARCGLPGPDPCRDCGGTALPSAPSR